MRYLEPYMRQYLASFDLIWPLRGFSAEKKYRIGNFCPIYDFFAKKKWKGRGNMCTITTFFGFVIRHLLLLGEPRKKVSFFVSSPPGRVNAFYRFQGPFGGPLILAGPFFCIFSPPVKKLSQKQPIFDPFWPKIDFFETASNALEMGAMKRSRSGEVKSGAQLIFCACRSIFQSMLVFRPGKNLTKK